MIRLLRKRYFRHALIQGRRVAQRQLDGGDAALPPLPDTRFAKGKKATARLTLSERARAAIRRALRTDVRIVVKLRVIVADGAGNRRTLTRQIRLRL
jgi:hypothetical protein